MDTAYVFSIDANEIQVKAALLAASLRAALGEGAELVATLPHGLDPDSLDPDASALLSETSVSLQPIDNPIGSTYPIGYKLLAHDVQTRADRIVFLDSDMLCLRAFDADAIFGPGFAAKPVDVGKAASSTRYWRLIYATFFMGLPRQRLQATVTGEEILPYYNAGVVSAPAHIGFGKRWSRVAKIIDRAFWIPWKRPWLDQLALPVAVRQSRLPTKVLTNHVNHPTHLVSLPKVLPIFSHYHGPDVIIKEPALLARWTQLTSDHRSLQRLASSYPDWTPLANAV